MLQVVKICLRDGPAYLQLAMLVVPVLLLLFLFELTGHFTPDFVNFAGLIRHQVQEKVFSKQHS